MAERGLLVLRRMGYLGPAAAHAVKLASQVLSESYEK